MVKVMVAGTGTGVGKTVVSAILTTMFQGDYWKPIQCGEEDTAVMKQWIDPSRVLPAAYSLKAPLSPHHAARLQKITIEPSSISLPKTTRPLIIEGVGGIFVPLTTKKLTHDLFKTWNCMWVIVSKHELGSINHTLLTCYALKKSGVEIAGLVFNGKPNPDSETAILEITKIPLLGRLLPEKKITPLTFQKYAKTWKKFQL